MIQTEMRGDGLFFVSSLQFFAGSVSLQLIGTKPSGSQKTYLTRFKGKLKALLKRFNTDVNKWVTLAQEQDI